MMQDYLKHRKSLVSKGKKKSSVAMPTSSAPSVPPSATATCVISDPRRGCYIVLSMFIFFSFFFSFFFRHDFVAAISLEPSLVQTPD